jgi:hypothetical protein
MTFPLHRPENTKTPYPRKVFHARTGVTTGNAPSRSAPGSRGFFAAVLAAFETGGERGEERREERREAGTWAQA